MRIVIEIDDGKVTNTTVSETARVEDDALVSDAQDAGSAPAEGGDEALISAEQGDIFGDTIPEYSTAPMEGEDAGMAPAVVEAQ